MTPRLTRGDLARVAWRTPLLQATWNYERQQGLGWAWCIQPVIERLYADPELRRQRLAEHTAYFNTQPTMASLALGAVAGLEEQRAAGGGPEGDGVGRVKGVLGSALAALGDRLFWSTLRPLAACFGVAIALTGSALGAVALWVVYNLAHLGLRFLGVGWGYRAGPGVLGASLRGRLEVAVRWSCRLGAILVGVIVALVLVPGGAARPVVFQGLLLGGIMLGLLTAFRARPSATQWALGVGALCVVAAWVAR
jgi:PTS system mannose-specific IID component